MENYHIIKKIGSGSFATVYLAQSENQLYALKVINKTEITAIYEQKLNNEIKILKKIDHPNIVKLYDVIETSESYYLILEYISGGDLYDLVTSPDFSKLQINDKKRIFNQITNAVKYLHDNNISHADLKLENILIDQDRNIKLTDFNLAYEFKEGEQNNLRCGSLEYAAPEIILGKLHYPCPSDIWALGVILYILQYGEFPFQQTPGKSPYSLYMKIAQAKYEFPILDMDKMIISNTSIINEKKPKDLRSYSSVGNLKMSPLKPLTDMTFKKNNNNNTLQANPFKSSADTLNYNQYGSLDNIEIINKLKNEMDGNDDDINIENAKTLEALDYYEDCSDFSIYMDESELDSNDDISNIDSNGKEDTNNKLFLKSSTFPRKSRSLNSKAIREYNEKLIRNDIDEMKDLIQKILKPDPNKRATLSEILKHPWTNNELQLRRTVYF